MSEDCHEHWPSNYFNYFTEIEEHFQRQRGTSLFLLSPLDWALIEMWKDAGIPVEAVLRGIEAAFVKWRARKNKIQQVNSLAYCAQAVLEEAKRMANNLPAAPAAEVEAPFSASELEAYLKQNAQHIRQAGKAPMEETAAALERLAGQAGELLTQLEELEQRLTAMEDKLLAIARAEQTEDDLFQARKELDSYLRPYRGKMTAEQLTMLEKQFLDRHLREKVGAPRLSLFYLR
ncbi:MAG: hypothetical protein JNK48_21855 [Bryobacterales bacterium]|nr:hypothetical protein [Bryobacterales bacterium]